MKTIIQRNLPLDQKYYLIDKKYIPLDVSIGGYCCDNCGKLIANIATVKNDENTYNIGFDCLETILINNSLLSTNDIKDYERIKKMIPKIIRFSKELKEIFALNQNQITGLIFERPDSYLSYWITYYLIKNGGKPYNTNVKLKDVDFDFMIDTLKNMLPKIEIIIK